MLNLGNKICRDPSVKVLLGDAYGFKSGIVWIEEHNYFKTMSCDEIIKLATNQKRDRTISKEKQIIYKNFFN
jgi:ABC-type branched-subunit amino acid transport system ATPase component